MRGGHYAAYQPIAAAFATQGGCDVLAVGYAIAGHAAVARNHENIVGAHIGGGIAGNDFDGAGSGARAAHISGCSDGNVAAAINQRIGSVERVAACDAAAHRIVVHEIIRKCHTETVPSGTAGAGVTDDYHTSAEATIAAQAIGGAVVDGDGAWCTYRIAGNGSTRCRREAFGAFIEESFVNNVFVNTEQGFELRRFGGFILLFSGFYFIVFLARHRKQADAKAEEKYFFHVLQG